MKVFLSSTSLDLAGHREATAAALERIDLPSGRMELFGARAEEPLVACLREIDACELFVGLYAHRYGFVPAGQQKSVTELEYDHAKRCGKPVFCFVVDPEAAWDETWIEPEPGKSRLQAFLTGKVRADQVVDGTFRSPEDLAAKVATALFRHLIDADKRLATDRHARAAELSLARADASFTLWLTNVGTHVIRDIEVTAVQADEAWLRHVHGPVPRLASSGHAAVELIHPIVGGWFHARIGQLSPSRGLGLGTFAFDAWVYRHFDLDLCWNDHTGLQRKSQGSVDVGTAEGRIALRPRA